MFLTRRFFLLITVLAVLVALGSWIDAVLTIGVLVLIVFGLLVVAEIAMLYAGGGVKGKRLCNSRFSNGDDNDVCIELENSYRFDVKAEVRDECPAVFQMRGFKMFADVPKNGGAKLQYKLKPTMRGEYKFGNINVLVSSKLGLASRRFVIKEPCTVKVYPSFSTLMKYDIASMKNLTREFGLRPIRKMGQSMEFEQIRDYVKGDDYRRINWKASARMNNLMVNVYQEEKSQSIYNVIDKGRSMRKAFGGMTLLNYAINASLLLSFASLKRNDKAGLVTFERNVDAFVPAAKNMGHIGLLQEALYKQKSSFYESDYESLFAYITKLVKRRSLLIIYTDFDNKQSLARQLPYLKVLSKSHAVLVVFFEDKELKTFSAKKPNETSDYFDQVIAEKFILEKRAMQTELRNHGIYTLLTSPDKLSLDVLNKYMELKSMAVI